MKKKVVCGLVLNIQCVCISISFSVYSIFALCEYLVVFSNIAFHYTAKYDFTDQQMSLAGGENEESHKEM